jgi:hypothetical protein
MSPQRSGPLAYWHSGGGLESRSGPITPSRALELFQFHVAEMSTGLERRDRAAVMYGARASLDIASAVVAANAWKAASGAAPVRVSHENTATWLRKP